MFHLRVSNEFFVLQDFENRIMPFLTVLADFRENVRVSARELKGKV